MALEATQLQQTSLQGTDVSVARQDLIQEDFESLIDRRGRRVLIEQALLCPCKSSATNQQSNCRNCGGTGYAFINPIETRLVLIGLDFIKKLPAWSDELKGVMSVTAPAGIELTYMDKVTALDGEDIHIEALNIKQYGITRFAYAAYPIKAIEYIALYTTVDSPYQQLQPSDYSISGNAIVINNIYDLDPSDLSLTIRYKYAPIFYMKEFKRSTMESYRLSDTGEKLQHLPIHGYAQRAHYVLNQPNLAGDRLLNNSSPINNCNDTTSCE